MQMSLGHPDDNELNVKANLEIENNRETQIMDREQRLSAIVGGVM